MTSHDDQFARYLRAKEAVDDRAVHRPTLSRLSAALDDRAEASPGDPLRVVSVGAGTGATCRRLLSWGVLDAHDEIKYVMVDRRRGMADRAAAAFARWAPGAGWDAEPTKNGFRIDRHGRSVSLTYATRDVLDAVAALPRALDLVVVDGGLTALPVDRVVDALVSRLTDDGLFYAPVTFDGHTAFRPRHVDDDAVVTAYHDAMRGDGRGGPDAGSDLFSVLPVHGATVVAAGGSDWVVHPPHDEAGRVFLDRVLGTVEESVAPGDVPDVDLQGWLSARHRQLEDDDLTYVAHNIDVLARCE